MRKDFAKWHKVKSTVHNDRERTFYHEREVWWCALGSNIGFEMDGKGNGFVRPVLIFKGFNKEVFLCVPLTTKLKEGKYYFNIDLGDNIPRKAILSQIRLIDVKRLEEKIVTLDKKQFLKIKQAIIGIIQ